VYADYVNMNWDQWDRHIYVKTEWAPFVTMFLIGIFRAILKEHKRQIYRAPMRFTRSLVAVTFGETG